MVSSCSNLNFLVSLILASMLSKVTFAQTGLINDICKQARNPSLCSKVLTSDPRSSNADLPTLGLIAIQQAEASAKSTQYLINVLVKPITSPMIQTIYDTCSENYSDALDSLGSCKKSLASQDFESLNSFASAVITDADTCDQGFEDEIVHEPPKLIEAGQELGDLADVISLISQKLAGK